MGYNRRNFIQKLGMLASATGLSAAFPGKGFSTNKKGKRPHIIAAANNAVTETMYGKVRGYTRDDIFTFKGIPYGASTGGAARFMPPATPAPWTDIRNTLVYGPISPQKQNTGWSSEEYGFLYQWIDGYQHEDCLRVNVWTPGLKDNKKRPVLFWIHGGGFFSGSSQEHPSYDGENMSRLGDVVVVSINHRLNVFGYLDLSDYGDRYAQSGNAGMLDIVAALQWVRDNIENFGGDKNNVTIFGQSGGGTKVEVLMAMPSASGLFHKAVCQSNSIVQVATHAYATQLTANFLEVLGITAGKLGELNSLPSQRLIEASLLAEKKMGSIVPSDVGRPGWQPVVDGHVLPTHPFDPIAPVISANIPLLVGTTRNEASASIDNTMMEDISEEGLKSKLKEKFGVKSSNIYDVMRKVHPAVKPVEILSFFSAQNPMAYLVAGRKAAQQAAPAWLYMFSWHTAMLDGRPRSFHCSEIPFVFYNTEKCETYTGGGSDARELAAKMAGAWISFARSGNPNHSGLPAWPSFNAQKGAMMIFDNTCGVKIDPDGAARELLEKIYYKKEI